MVFTSSIFIHRPAVKCFNPRGNLGTSKIAFISNIARIIVQNILFPYCTVKFYNLHIIQERNHQWSRDSSSDTPTHTADRPQYLGQNVLMNPRDEFGYTDV